MAKLRPIFCLVAFPDDQHIPTADMSCIKAYFSHLQNRKTGALEFELAAESVLRNNGYDPLHDRGWKEAGIEGGYKQALEIMRSAYIEAVPQFMEILRDDIKENPYDYTPATLRYNSFMRAVSSFKRGFYGEPAAYLVSDSAWQQVGYKSVVELQQDIRKMFVDARVGGYLAYQLDPNSHDLSTTYPLSMLAADHLIRAVFPELADELRIPMSIQEGLSSVGYTHMPLPDQVRQPG